MPLPTYIYAGTKYYIDDRLKQFRSASTFPDPIEFIDFDSPKGEMILAEMAEPHCPGCNAPLTLNSVHNSISRYGHGELCNACGVREATERDFITRSHSAPIYDLVEDRTWDPDDGKTHVRFTGTEDECFKWVLAHTPFSFHEAITRQGYSLKLKE